MNLLVLEDTPSIVEAIQDLLEGKYPDLQVKFVTSVREVRDLRDWKPEVAWLDHRVLGPETGDVAYRILRERYGEDIQLIRISALNEPGYPDDSIFLSKVGNPYRDALALMFSGKN